jgi:hypothetical protein
VACKYDVVEHVCFVLRTSLGNAVETPVYLICHPITTINDVSAKSTVTEKMGGL